MTKISEYPAKTVFNDTDLYDCSTEGTVSEQVTYAQLKADLASTLGIMPTYRQEGETDTLFLTSGSFNRTNITPSSLDLNFVSFSTTGMVSVWITGVVNFPAGATNVRLDISLPTTTQSGVLVGDIPPILADGAFFAYGHNPIFTAKDPAAFQGCFGYSTNNESYKTGSCWLIEGGNNARVGLYAPVVNVGDTQINIGAQINLPLELR